MSDTLIKKELRCTKAQITIDGDGKEKYEIAFDEGKGTADLFELQVSFKTGARFAAGRAYTLTITEAPK